MDILIIIGLILLAIWQLGLVYKSGEIKTFYDVKALGVGIISALAAIYLIIKLLI